MANEHAEELRGAVSKLKNTIERLDSKLADLQHKYSSDADIDEARDIVHKDLDHLCRKIKGLL